MTWQSAISFRPFAGIVLFSAILLMLSGQILAATVSGQVRLVDSNNSAVKKEKDFSGVAVWLTSSQDPEVHPSRKHAQMLQKDKKFQPHVLVVSKGSLVDFPNLDPIFHNAFSNFYGQTFDVSLYPPGSSRTVRFSRAGIVRVFCNIHPSMSAVIVVVDSGYFTTSSRDGAFSIPNVSPGVYQIHFFHERATPEALEKLSHSLTVGEAPEELPAVTISEAGYLPAAHKNKYGRDYPPGSDGTYSLPVK